MSTKFFDLLAFGGPPPERINGRLAMIGFLAAMGVELARGTDVAAQLAEGGLSWFVITSVVLSMAYVISLSQGVSVEFNIRWFDVIKRRDVKRQSRNVGFGCLGPY
ncbi:hypothetical protein MKW94_014352 [Papaver nudicaule]|uniref:Uncharacterized protein n=1 Tax=Papaver nudicaule TaxID=74823 RepID=A0AA41SGT6_PAPNU|nr:hypothetical protein [Papaver nudicaule]